LKLIVEPDDGVVPLVLAIQRARKTLDMPIFRLDHVEIDKAVKGAVKRGVEVRALIAHTNAGGEKALRKLELRLLATGATVSRTADDLVRYHNKFMIVDRSVLYVLSFNYTHVDIDKSRGFGLATRNRPLVQEAMRLFEADFNRRSYTPRPKTFVVSPDNARLCLAGLLRSARRQLLIYDPKVTDNAMIRILQERAKAGVEIKILGTLEKPDEGIEVESFPGRLHARVIIRDGRQAFIGSQSLRRLELERRREVGAIFGDGKVVRRLMDVFEQDWAETPTGRTEQAREEKAKGGAA
jgi:phosphatidylserine/phosphatidylglycerophosphate/cardiolipin synthase-like enzyme